MEDISTKGDFQIVLKRRIGNRREYVREQLKGGSPVFAASLRDGILLLGVGAGHSKVFELFDRHALAGLGHPADIEKIRQAAIDAAHLEAFNRAPEDVSLRRLIGFGLSPQLKTIAWRALAMGVRESGSRKETAEPA